MSQDRFALSFLDMLAEFFQDNITIKSSVTYSFRCKECNKTYELQWSDEELNQKIRFYSPSTGRWVVPKPIFNHIVDNHEELGTLLALGGLNAVQS